MLKKNHLPISQAFENHNKEFQSLFVSNETSNDTKSNHNKIRSEDLMALKNSKFLKLKTFNYRKIRSFLIKQKPDFVLIGGYRIYDQLLSAICNIEKIKVYKIQHGFEIDFVNYKINSIIFKLVKILRLLNSAWNLGLISQSNPLRLSFHYIRYMIFGGSLKDTLLNNRLFNPSMLFVYSDYYKDFWFNKFGLNQDKMQIIDPPDFSIIKDLKFKKKEDACCYIAQTLVEDGRMQESEFVKFISEYKKIAKNVKTLYIKLHPRSELKYYDKLNGISNIQLVREFPKCKSYISHYSSMIFTAAFITDKIIIHEIKGHKTNNIFKQVNPEICQSVNQIIQTLKAKEFDNEFSVSKKIKDLRYYVSFKNIDPFNQIYKCIIKDLNSSLELKN
jgi:hypothetical protein